MMYTYTLMVSTFELYKTFIHFLFRVPTYLILGTSYIL